MIAVVYGAKGGVGASAIATALALAAERDAALVDLDLMNGDLYGALDLPATTTLADVLADVDARDPLGGEALRRRLPRHGAGPYVLSQAGRIDQLDAISWPAVAELLRRLEGELDHVVVDGVRDLGDVALAAVDAAGMVVMVTTPDVAAVRATRRARVLLRQVGVGDERLVLVVNRARRRMAVPAAAITEAIELPVAALVKEGAPPAARDLSSLATRLYAPERTLITRLPAPRWRLFRRAREA